MQSVLLQGDATASGNIQQNLDALGKQDACATQVCNLLEAGQWTSKQSQATPQQSLPSPSEAQAVRISLQQLIQLKQAGNE